jgi:tetratricopeptide (TPR) repeat protein
MQFTSRHRRIAASFISAISIMSVAPSSATTSLEEQCEKQWIVDSGTLAATPGATAATGALLRQWRSREAACGTTSIYWGRLAMIQVLANDLAGAKASLARAPTSPAYSYAVDLAAVQVAVQERMTNPAPMTRADIAKFESAYAAVVAKHPQWPTGYAMVGAMQTMLGKHADAVRSLEVAARGDVYQLWSVYRNLAISLSALGKHTEALAAADKAGQMNPSLLSDPPFAYAVAISHAALGYLDDAADTLKVIASRRPDIQKDPEYLRAVDFYQAQRARVKR